MKERYQFNVKFVLNRSPLSLEMIWHVLLFSFGSKAAHNINLLIFLL